MKNKLLCTVLLAAAVGLSACGAVEYAEQQEKLAASGETASEKQDKDKEDNKEDKDKEETKEAANSPIKHYDSLQELNKEIGCYLSKLDEIGVSDVEFTSENRTAYKMARYEFRYKKNRWTLDAGHSLDNVSGIKIDGRPITELAKPGEIVSTDNLFFTYWFVGNMQYHLCAWDASAADQETFQAAYEVFRANSEEGQNYVEIRPVLMTVFDENGKILDGTYEAELDTSSMNHDELQVVLYTKDIYDTVDIKTMAEGNTIICEEQPIEVLKIEEDRYGYVAVNDGFEEGGVTFLPGTGNYYEALYQDNIPYHTKHGDVTIKLDDSVVLKVVKDWETEPEEVYTGSEIAEYLSTTNKAHIPDNTKIRFEGEKPVEILVK